MELTGKPIVAPDLPRLLREFLRMPGLNCWERLIIIRAGQIVASRRPGRAGGSST